MSDKKDDALEHLRSLRAPGVPRPDESMVGNTDTSSDDQDDPDPTHRCMCGEIEKYIPNTPTGDQSWCDECGAVKRFERIDRGSQ